MPNPEWRIKVPRDRFEALRGDERFRQVLVLGRMLNSLRFLQCTFLGAVDLKPPADIRHQFSAFFFLVAVMYEGLRLLKRMGKLFRDSKCWRQKISPILQDRAFERLFTSSMDPLRNQAVFHFFEDSIETPLAACDPKDYTVVVGSGRGQKQVFYELSDLLALDIFIGTLGSTQEQTRRAMRLMDQTLDLLNKVVEASASLIAEYCRSEDMVFESSSRKGSSGT